MIPIDEGSAPFALLISGKALDHIRDKHFRDALEHPLWADFLKNQPDLETALLSQVQASSARPLYVQYDQYDQDGCFLHRTREFITPSGLVVIAHLTREAEGTLVTAFFPYETFGLRPQRRWCGAVRSRIKMYACATTRGLAELYRTPPLPYQAYPSTDPAGLRRRVLFWDEACWGIRVLRLAEGELRVFDAPHPWPEG